jgi:hypothetical protein
MMVSFPNAGLVRLPYVISMVSEVLHWRLELSMTLTQTLELEETDRDHKVEPLSQTQLPGTIGVLMVIVGLPWQMNVS